MCRGYKCGPPPQPAPEPEEPECRFNINCKVGAVCGREDYCGAVQVWEECEDGVCSPRQCDEDDDCPANRSCPLHCSSLYCPVQGV